MKSKKILATLLLSAMLFSGCGFKGQKAVIKVNNHPITQEQFDKLMEQQIAASPFAQMGDLKSNKDGFLYLMNAQSAVNQLVVQELMNQEAKKRGIKISDKDVDAEIEKYIEHFGGKDKLMDLLKQRGVNISKFRQDVKEQLKMQKLTDVAANTSVTEADCKKFYDKNISKFKHDKMVRASHILISANPFQITQELTADNKKKLSEQELKAKVEKVMAEKKAKADKIANELKADNSKFAAYAKKYSDDTNSAKQGGDLGFFEKQRMVPEFATVAFGMKPNTISSVVQTQFGYHIIFVTDRKEAGIEPYEKVKNDIMEYLKFEKRKKSWDDLIESAKKNAKIEYIDNSLNPDEINKKLHSQVNDATNGAKDKLDAQAAPKTAPAKK